MTSPRQDAADLTISDQAPLRDALELINRTAHGIAFAVDGNGAMTGVLTDGDIRRALLNGVLLTAPILQVMRRDFVSLPVGAPEETIASMLSDRITHIPLLDANRRPVDYASFSRLHRIPVSEPALDGNELAYVVDCVKTNWISSQGRYVQAFEKTFSEFHEGLPALSVSNGTVALHLAMVALGVGPGDEVIVPNLTFAATLNTVVHAGATPVLVDVDPETWTMDAAAVRAALTSKTRAIIPVHLYGHPCNMGPLLELAKEHGLFVIEDCAEALGALYQGRPVGVFGDAACFSFFGNKLITTGEGGMILFRDPEIFARAKRLRDHGMDPQKRYWHVEVGFNYRLTNLQAAVGLAQMERVQTFIDRKKWIAAQYEKGLRSVPGIRFPVTASWASNVYWLYTIQITEALGVTRDDLMRKLLANGVETRPLFYPMHSMPVYASYGRGAAFPVSEAVSASGMSLPSAVSLSEAEIDQVVQAFRRIVSIRDLYHTAGKHP